jgi:release factor glutamine methyltransferase
MPVLDPIAKGPIAEGETERLGEVVRRAARTLAEAGVETPGLDARLLLAAATGLGAAELISRPDGLIEQGARRRFEELVRRRCLREPVSRILGERAFFGRSFKITAATLDPRPDSETLIETALDLADANGWRSRQLRILDVGTGSGSLLVTLLAELPLATGLGTDLSARALEVAAANARRLGVLPRAEFEQRDALDGIEGQFDLVVCNPPYVATGQVSGLAPEVRDYDPPGALDGGGDGLDVFRKIIPALARVVPCGWVIFEVGAGQAAAVADLLRRSVAGTRRGGLLYREDLAGHVRCVAMERQL